MIMIKIFGNQIFTKRISLHIEISLSTLMFQKSKKSMPLFSVMSTTEPFLWWFIPKKQNCKISTCSTGLS